MNTSFILESVINFVETKSWFSVVTALIALFSAIAAITPTPKKGSFFSKVYMLVDLLALNVGKAKDKG